MAEPKKVKITYHDFTCLHLNQKKEYREANCSCILKLPQVKTQTYIGIIIDGKFKWDKQIDKLYSRLRSCTYGFQNLVRYVDKKTLIIVYNALVDSILRYGVLAWGNASQTRLEKLRKIQNTILKIIHRNIYLKYITYCQ